ncbi:MAG TPA: fumarylacetoacetate hydrolase family protein [Dehalococcoidia bacterium]|nr:fumarylacetoacetate hydrolase family protein [Dehalococcoidia bacterium]
MKLLTYDAATGPKAGVLAGDRVLDVDMLLPGDGPVRDVQALLELPGQPLDRLRESMSRPGAPEGLPLAGLRLRSPILRPPTVRDFMAYEQHVASAARNRGGTVSEAWYRFPVFYFSSPLCLIGPDEDMPYPSASNRLDFEFELACVIGREGTDVDARDGMQYIAGFAILNDWSARDVQRDESQIGLGPAKGKDFRTSLGPVVVTADEMQPYLKDQRLHVHMLGRINGEVWSEAQGGEMYHSFGDFVERASRDSRIVPGDVFGTGTCGTGCCNELVGSKIPGRRWLKPGDVVELEVEGIGVLRNRVGPKLNPDLNQSYRYRPVEPAPAT